MSLATRCSDCGTVFRVVQDQLRVSEGWVRCGRCDAVFNAFEDLLDLERDAPIAAQDGIARRPTVETTGAASDGLAAADRTEATEATEADDADDEDDEDDAFNPSGTDHTSGTDDTGDTAGAAPLHPAALPLPAELSERASAEVGIDPQQADATALSPAPAAIDDEIDEHLFGHRHRGPPRDVDQRDRLDFSDARFDSELSSDALFETPAADVAPVPDAAELPLEVAATPEFLRRAERRARWQSPRVRVALGGAALLLAATIALQTAHHFRDALAARWPLTRPLLAAWCTAAGCSIEAPRRIDEISVESTALTRAPGLDAFRLAVMLRSHSKLALALPSVELSLTDASGQLVARRALGPADFRVAQAVLPPGAELPLQLLFDARDSPVTGYTVEIFYP